MKRTTPPDRLSRDAMAARAAGMSYGQWKAEHPITPDEEPEPKITDTGVREVACLHCGKTILLRGNTSRRYCDDVCRQRAGNARYHEVRKDMLTGVCQICGRPISTFRGRKYCGRSCQNQANREKARLRQRRIYSEEKEKT